MEKICGQKGKITERIGKERFYLLGVPHTKSSTPPGGKSTGIRKQDGIRTIEVRRIDKRGMMPGDAKGACKSSVG